MTDTQLLSKYHALQHALQIERAHVDALLRALHLEPANYRYEMDGPVNPTKVVMAIESRHQKEAL